MKRKIIAGTLALMSVLAIAQVKDSFTNTEKESGRKFWGVECIEVGKGTGRTATMLCCRYVFWVNVGCETTNIGHGEL